jgi:hypothetical protein
MEGGSDVSSRVIADSQYRSRGTQDLPTQKYSIESRHLPRASDVTHRGYSNSVESDIIAIVKGTFPQSSDKEADEVNFSYDSTHLLKKWKKVQLRSNSISSGYSSSGSKDSRGEEQKMQKWVSMQFLNNESSPSNTHTRSSRIENFQKSNSSIENILKDYLIVDRRDIPDDDRKQTIESVLDYNTSPWDKIDEDEITLIEFTNSNWLELSSDEENDDAKTSKSDKIKASKHNKKLEPWESKVLTNYGIKQISVDLSNSFSDIDNSMIDTNTHNEVSRNPSTTKIADIKKSEKISVEESYLNNKDQNPKRIQRIIKDSIGSACNHIATDEEFKLSSVKEMVLEVPKRHKPEITKIQMLSGDTQKPKATKLKPIPSSIEMTKVKPFNARDRKVANMSVDNSMKEKVIPLERTDVQRLYSRHQSPRTRNDIPTMMSTRINTVETRIRWDTRFNTCRDFETSPYFHRKMITQVNPYSEVFHTSTNNRCRSDLSRSPSIGPSKREMSPKNNPKVIEVPQEILNNKDSAGIKKRLRKQSMPYKLSSKTSNISSRTNLTAWKKPYSRNLNFMSPINQQKEYTTHRSPYTHSEANYRMSPVPHSKTIERMIELENSVRKLNEYKETIYLLSTQNKEMADTISVLQKELQKEKSRHNELEKTQSLSNLRQHNSNYNNSTNNLVKSNNEDSGNYNVRQMRTRRDYHPLVSVDTNAETVKLSANYIRSSNRR